MARNDVKELRGNRLHYVAPEHYKPVRCPLEELLWQGNDVAGNYICPMGSTDILVTNTAVVVGYEVPKLLSIIDPSQVACRAADLKRKLPLQAAHLLRCRFPSELVSRGFD